MTKTGFNHFNDRHAVDFALEDRYIATPTTMSGVKNEQTEVSRITRWLQRNKMVKKSHVSMPSLQNTVFKARVC